MIVAEITNVDLSNWPNGTSFFSANNGQYFVVLSDLEERSQSRITIVRRPTVILYTDEKAFAENLTPDFSYPPGTVLSEALTLAGYELT